jgi:hypothetical protein
MTAGARSCATTRPVGSDLAIAEPRLFDATTWKRRVEATSAR